MNAQQSMIQIAIPATLAVLLLALFSPPGSITWSQSPLSPLFPPDAVPERLTDTSPIAPGKAPPSAPSSGVLEKLSLLSSPQFWSSPLPWTVVGALFFGSLVWGVFVLLRRHDASKQAQ
jgi:hypothetical protein